MPEQNRQFVTSMAVRTLIRIYSYENTILTGSITNAYLNQTFFFHDVLEMASILEQIYDTLSFPQSSLSYRSFRPTNRKHKQDSTYMKAGGDFMNMNKMPPELENTPEKASFLVHVQFRQHATWQGNITWVDKGVTQQFRSVLEMIRLMTDAVESGDPDQTGFSLPMEKKE